jgi:IS5 family transposase
MEGAEKMKQQTLARAGGFERYSKKTRRPLFLKEDGAGSAVGRTVCADRAGLCQGGERAASRGRSRCCGFIFCSSGSTCRIRELEEALYDSAGMRQFVGIDLGREPVPDETTVCRFRYLLKQHGLGERLFERVGDHLQAKGLRLSTGTVVDATINMISPIQELLNFARPQSLLVQRFPRPFSILAHTLRPKPSFGLSGRFGRKLFSIFNLQPGNLSLS